jgi:uncharacterized protein YqfB (UPF0267 family)
MLTDEEKLEIIKKREEEDKRILKMLEVKTIDELSLDEMRILRRLKFRKNLQLDSLKDHVKEIFNALQFPAPNSSYTDDYQYTDDKSYNTLHPDDEYHYKKSFMKTFEQEKMKHKIVIRK